MTEGVNEMEADLSIINCKTVGSRGIIEAGISTKNGKIVSVARDTCLPKAKKVINAMGNYVMPGLIDNHTHIYLSKEEVSQDTGAAVCGGVTTVGIFIGIGSSRLTGSYKDDFINLKEKFEQDSYCDGVFHGSICSDKHIEEIPMMAKKFGITSFKFYMAYKGEEGRQIGIEAADDGALYMGFREIAKLGYPARAWVHAENIDIILRLKKDLISRRKGGLRSWTEARPNFVEVLDIERAISLARITKVPLYIVHVSSGESVEAISRAKAEGLDLFAETTPAYLTLSGNSKVGVIGKINPSLKDEQSISRLWKGLREGIIECMGTDHSSAPRKEMKQEIWSARPGFPGVETLLPLMLSEGVNKGRITLEQLVEVCCLNNAKVLGIFPKKGILEVGSDADIVIVNLKKTKRVSAKELHHIADFCVHEGWELKGWPVVTIVGGKIMMKDGILMGAPGKGRYVPRSLLGETSNEL